MLENLDLALVELVGKVETLSPKLWELAMKEVYVNLFTSVFLIVVAIGLLCVGIYLLKKAKSIKQESVFDMTKDFCFALGLIAILASVLITCVSIYDIGAILINPEYRALEIIMELVK